MKKYLFTALLSFMAGSIVFFFVGRSTVHTKTELQYVHGETISGSAGNSAFAPIKEETPESALLPIKEVIHYRDTGSLKTITKYVYQAVDTTAIIDSYVKKRSYNLVAFDNREHGKLLLFPTVQYNKLTGMNYEFTPIHKQISTYREKVWQPFASVSYSSLDYLGLGGGIFYHHVGFEYQYNMDMRKRRGNYHWISGKYLF